MFPGCPSEIRLISDKLNPRAGSPDVERESGVYHRLQRVPKGMVMKDVGNSKKGGNGIDVAAA